MVPLLLNLEIKWVSQPMHTDTGGVGNIPNRSTLPVFYLILYLQLSSSQNLKHSIVVHVTSQDLTLNMKSGNQVKKEAMLELGTHKCSQHVSRSQFVRPMPLHIKQNLRLMTVHTLYSLYFAFRHNFLYFTTSGQK